MKNPQIRPAKKRGKNLGKKPVLQVLTHIASLVPLAVLVFLGFTGGLTVNPIQEATLRTGKTALVLLVLTLSCTPIYTLFGYRPVLNLRRPLGLYAFMYAAIHFTIFIAVDYGLNWNFIRDGFLEKRFALVGFASFLLMVPLALTSTKSWQRRLGKTWKAIHRFIYGAGILAVVHYIWVVKSDIREPVLWSIAVVILLILRTRQAKKWIQKARKFSIRRKRRDPGSPSTNQSTDRISS